MLDLHRRRRSTRRRPRRPTSRNWPKGDRASGNKLINDDLDNNYPG